MGTVPSHAPKRRGAPSRAAPPGYGMEVRLFSLDLLGVVITPAVVVARVVVALAVVVLGGGLLMLGAGVALQDRRVGAVAVPEAAARRPVRGHRRREVGEQLR